MRRRHQYGHAHELQRAVLLERNPWCENNDGRRATVADHDPPVALHRHVHGSGCCSYRATCIDCSRRQGAEVAALLRAKRLELGTVDAPEFVEPSPSPGPADPLWDEIRWLQPLREVPDDATWPRFMSGPHPAATSTLLPQFEVFVRRRTGCELLWFQRLAAARLLEVNRDGQLVWLSWFLTVARQVGKSFLVINLLLFLVTYAPKLWPHLRADVLYCSRTLVAAESLIRNVLNWARDTGGPWTARQANGSKSVTYDVDHSLLIRAVESVYGETCGLAVVDEIWDVAQHSIDESVEPATLAAGGQVGYTSTAHRRATTTGIRLRHRGLTTLDAPDDLLILEWSAAPWRERDDEEAWREASPHWTEHRRRRLLAQLERAHSGVSIDPSEPDPIAAFDTQQLNRWPSHAAARQRADRLLPVQVWAELVEDVQCVPAVIAVEDWLGHGAATAAVGRAPDGRWVLGGWCFPSRQRAFEWAAQQLAQRAGAQCVVGATLRGDPAVAGLGPVRVAMSAETRAGLALLRTLVDSRQVINDGSSDLAAQIEAARVTETASGLALLRGPRADLLKAALWALRQAVQDPTAEPALAWPRSA